MRVVVGRIGRPHGIRGEVTVEPRTDEVEDRFAPGEALLADGPGVLTVARSHWHSGRLLVAFDGIDDRNAAEALRGILLEVERDPAEQPTDPDEFYDSALEGCSVVGDDGRSIGIVTAVVHLPGQDLLDVLVDDRSVLVPFGEAFVPSIDLVQRRITVTPPPGLLDLED